MKKLLYSVATALMFVFGTAGAQTPPTFKYFSGGSGITITSMTGNGLWGTATGANEAGRDCDPYLLNIATGEKIELSSDTFPSGAYGVSADGKLVVGTYNMFPAYYKDGKWTEFPKVSDAQHGIAQAVTADGKYVVGNFTLPSTSTESWPETPAFWEYNETRGQFRRITLDDKLPKTDAVGNTTEQRRLTDISADGNILLGCLSYSHPGSGCAWFVYDRAKDSYDMIGLDQLPSMSHVDQASLNNAGTMVTGIVHYVPESIDEEENEVTFSYNVQTKEFKLFLEDSDLDVGAFNVDNQGTIYAARPAINVRRWVTCRVGDYWYDLDQILKQRYGMDFTATTGFEYTGVVMAVSDDGKTLACTAYTDENYVISFSETPAEAAKHVNLLANNLLFPAAGATLSQITTVQVTFDRNVELQKNAVAYIYDGQNNPVASSLSIAPKSASSKKTYSINFRKYTLTEGETYRFVIPAGTFNINGDASMACNEISASYRGRASKPVQPRSFSPANGMTVSSLSYTSPLTVEFDVPVEAVANVVGKLYQDGTEDALCDLNISTSGSMMSVYPSATRNFYKDINYKVVIPAGAVTDQVGACPNEAIELNYVGIYERPLPAPGATIFEENFEDPANALANFLLWDGDELSPTDVPLGWGFQKENTPWLFDLRGDSISTDYCAGAHSMYTTSGKADDWMVTPQLYVPTGNYKLYWMAQSYKKSKSDVLKVYVWENNEALSALSSALTARIKNEGKLVYEGRELPGESEEELLGDWVQHYVNLDEYKGKNIYIAFLNDNLAQSAVFVDSIKVVYEGNFALGNMTEQMVTQQQETTVSGYVKVTTKDKTYNSIRAYYRSEDGQNSDEVTADNLNLTKDGVYKFTFSKPLPLKQGRVTNFTLGVDLDGDVQETQCSVSNLAFTPHKNVVIEKFTGSSCMYCPLGVVAFEHLESSFPENFIPVEIHTTAGGSDVYAYEDYAAAIGYTSAPSGRVNRIDTVYAPIYEKSAKYTYTSPEGNITFTDIMLRELETLSEATVSVSASHNAAVRQLDITSDVTFALDLRGANYKISYILLEDSLSGNQRNGCYSWDQEILGEWCNGGAYAMPYVGGYTYTNVARAVLGSYDGIAGYIPTMVYAGEPVTSESSWSTSNVDYVNFANAKIVCLLINANTGRVVNSAVCRVTGDVDGIDEVLGDAAGSEVEYFDLSGRRLADKSSVKGVVIAKIHAAGKTVVKKILVK